MRIDCDEWRVVGKRHESKEMQMSESCEKGKFEMENIFEEQIESELYTLYHLFRLNRLFLEAIFNLKSYFII